MGVNDNNYKSPKFYGRSSSVIWSDPKSTWFTRSGNDILKGTYNYLKPFYDKWAASGSLEDYNAYKNAVDEMNEQQRYGYARIHLPYLKHNNTMFKYDDVGRWQNTIKLEYPYINNAINKNFGQYRSLSSNPTSGDNPSRLWTTDFLHAGETDDRTPWGNYINPNDPDYLRWKQKLAEIGINYNVGPEDWNTGNVLYGFLEDPKSLFFNRFKGDGIKVSGQDVIQPLQPPTVQTQPLTRAGSAGSATGGGAGGNGTGGTGGGGNNIPEGKINLKNIGDTLQRILGNPDLYAFGRLTGNLINNERVYNEALKGINPVLKQSYHTHRQVVGDEATKQAYYRRAAQGQSKAAQPFTADADKQIAYQFEAKRVGDELRAQGDLADNQEIRRTSDESNQHQWANTQRDTEVANANIASINQANSLKHNLLAQKHSAQWSSIDNYLQGIEYRKRQRLAEQQQFDDEIFSLQQQQDLLYSPEIIAAKKKLQSVLDQHKTADGTDYDWENDDVQNAITEWKNTQYQVAIKNKEKAREYYKTRKLINFWKSGTKVTRKKKEDLLYKSTRDVVEHFRKMSKISSDAQNRKTPKIERFAPHPNGTKKYQQGGVAPFTVYKPVTLGGETSRTTETNSSSRSSSKKSDDDNDSLLKELFKILSFKGLPSDSNSVFKSVLNLMKKKELFGNELTTDDMATVIIRQLQKINEIQLNKEEYDNAYKAVSEKNAMSELAIDQYGRVAVQNTKTGKIEYKSVKDISDEDNEGIYNPLTNGDLLQLRYKFPAYAFDNEMLKVASNATSMEEIATFLKNQLPNLGSDIIEGYTLQDSNLIKQGIKVLKDAPAGEYKFKDVNQKKQVEYALKYLYSVLPKRMKNLIQVNSGTSGVTPLEIIASLVGSVTSQNFELPGGSGKKSSSSGSDDEKGDSTNSAGLAFVLGQGPREVVTFNTGTSLEVKAIGIKGTLQTHSNENLGQGSTLQDASQSQQGGYLQWQKATFGGSRLNSLAYTHILLNDSTIMGFDLPYIKDSNGNEIPNFQQLKKMEKADFIIKSKGISDNDHESINKIYIDNELPPKFLPNGELNKQQYKRFAAIQVTLDEQALKNKDAILADEVEIANDNERELYEETMKSSSKTKDYSLSDGMIITGWGKDQLYKGTVFIPYDEDIAFAAISSGKGFKQNLPDNVAAIQEKQYAPKVSQYKAPEITLSQLKNI